MNEFKKAVRLNLKSLGNPFIEEYPILEKVKARLFGGLVLSEIIGIGFWVLELITWAEWLDFYSITYLGVIRD